MYSWKEFKETVLPETALWSGNPVNGIDLTLGVSPKTGEGISRTVGQDENTHGLITGVIGSGMSNFVHNLIMNTCCQYGPDDLELWLIDCKGVAFEAYLPGVASDIGLPHLSGISCSKSRDDRVCALRDLVALAKQRNSEIHGLGCKDIREYNAAIYTKALGCSLMPRVLVVVNSADVVFSDKDKAAKEFLEYLLEIGSSVGIHLLLVFDNLAAVAMRDSITDILNWCTLLLVMRDNPEIYNLIFGNTELEPIEEASGFIYAKGSEDSAPVLVKVPCINTSDIIDTMGLLCEEAYEQGYPSLNPEVYASDGGDVG